jgi:hypothetical protein
VRRVGRLGWIVALLLLAGLVSPPMRAQLRGDPVSCVVTVSTATTITAVGGACAARAGLALNITDISFSTNAGGIAADTFNTLKYGTGTTCGTGTTVFWGAMTTAATQATVFETFATPLRLPQNVDVCWINSTAGSKFLVIAGYYTP